MNLNKLAVLLIPCLLSLNFNASAGGNEPNDTLLKRRTITLTKNGSLAGEIFLPMDSITNIKWTSNSTDYRADGSVYLSGNVLVTLSIGDVSPISLSGDEMELKSEKLDNDQSNAVRDLQKMHISDQLLRRNPSLIGSAQLFEQTSIDSRNMKRLSEIVDRYGWPGKDFAGIESAKNALLVLQHADLNSQKKYLPLIRAAASRNEVTSADLATLEDRILVRQGLPQVYSTQFQSFSPLKIFPVENPSQLEERRRNVGLLPMSEYINAMKELYNPDTK